MTTSDPTPSGEREPAAGSRATRGLDRDRQIVELSIAGMPIVEIGHLYGYVSPGPAIRLVDRALDLLLPQLDPDMQRRLDVARLDRLLSTWWGPATTDDPTAAQLVLDILQAKSRVRGDEHEVHALPDSIGGAIRP